MYIHIYIYMYIIHCIIPLSCDSTSCRQNSIIRICARERQGKGPFTQQGFCAK